MLYRSQQQLWRYNRRQFIAVDLLYSIIITVFQSNNQGSLVCRIIYIFDLIMDQHLHVCRIMIYIYIYIYLMITVFNSNSKIHGRQLRTVEGTLGRFY